MAKWFLVFAPPEVETTYTFTFYVFMINLGLLLRSNRVYVEATRIRKRKVLFSHTGSNAYYRREEDLAVFTIKVKKGTMMR